MNRTPDIQTTGAPGASESERQLGAVHGYISPVQITPRTASGLERGAEWAELVCADFVTWGFNVPDESVDLILTSPPYDDLRAYGGIQWNMEVFAVCAEHCARVLKPGGVCVWVVADATKDGSETGTSLRQALYFRDELDLNLHDTMVYRRETIPLTSNRYQPEWEYMFVFSKGAPKTFNPLKVRSRLHEWGRPEIGRSKAKRNAAGEHQARHTQALTKEMKIRGNVWEYNPRPGPHQDPEKFGHPATFPDALARDHIVSWTNPGDKVLDPFCGSGTTLVGAKQCSRQYAGCDLNPDYCQIAKQRLGQVLFATEGGEVTSIQPK